MNKNTILNTIKIIKGFDRNTPKSQIPDGFTHIHKEIFRYGDIIIKGTNYHKNKDNYHYLFINEAYWLEYFQKYDFVPRFYGKYLIENDIFLVIEYFTGKDLSKINIFKKMLINKQSIKFQLLKILEVLKSENVTHKDLRPENIILTNSGEIKIIDFQFCSKVGEDLKTNNENQLRHYKKAINNVGGDYRSKYYSINSLECDAYSISKILKYL